MSDRRENLAGLVEASAARWPGEVAVSLDGRDLTYRVLDRAVNRVAAELIEGGLQPGDRVGLILPNVLQFPILYFGIVRAGGIVVPMNILLSSREVEFAVADSGAGRVFVWHELGRETTKGIEAGGADCIEVDAEWQLADGSGVGPVAVPVRGGTDTGVLLYTSGTTGKPKGAELSHDNLCVNAKAIAGLMSLGPGTTCLGALPLFHIFGQSAGMNSAVAAGAHLALMKRFDPGTALRAIERDRVEVFLGVPTMFVSMLHEHRDASISTLDLCVSGGASLPVEVLRGFEARFGARILEGYGLSETAACVSFNHANRVRKPGSIGTPIAGVEMKLVDDDGNEVGPDVPGEILIRGPNVMKGYWQRPTETAAAFDADGWFRSGDIATVDADGYYFIVDRKKDLIIRGGYNVYPREIEEVLYEHPEVLEAAVVGLSDDLLGEEIGAAVVPLEGSDVTPDQLRSWVKERVAAYKYPRRVWLTDSLPKGSTGKILKREIAAPSL